MDWCSCYLLLQSLITLLAIFADMPRVGWGPISGCEEPDLANWSSVSFPSIPCLLAPIPFGSCCVLTVLPGIDGSPRLICSLSGNCQRPLWLLDCWKEYRCSTCMSHFHILPSVCLSDIFLAGILWCGAKGWSYAPFSSRIYTPKHQCLLFGLGPVLVLDQAPGDICFETVLPCTLVRELGGEWLVVGISRHVIPLQ